MGKGLDSILLGQWWVASHTVTSPFAFHTLTQCLSHLALGLLVFFFLLWNLLLKGKMTTFTTVIMKL